MSYVTRTFEAEFLTEEICVTWGKSSKRVVLHEAVDKRRWYTNTRVIFSHEDQLWEIFYMDPASEVQEGQDRFYENPVKATLVEPFEKTVIDYRKVSA